jgi:hypothetical protein
MSLSDYENPSVKELILQKLQAALEKIVGAPDYRYSVISVTREPVDMIGKLPKDTPALQISDTDAETFDKKIGDHYRATISPVISGIVKFDRDLPTQATLFMADLVKRICNCQAELGEQVKALVIKESDSSFIKDNKGIFGVYFELLIAIDYLFDGKNP